MLRKKNKFIKVNIFYSKVIGCLNNTEDYELLRLCYIWNLDSLYLSLTK